MLEVFNCISPWNALFIGDLNRNSFIKILLASKMQPAE